MPETQQRPDTACCALSDLLWERLLGVYVCVYCAHVSIRVHAHIGREGEGATEMEEKEGETDTDRD